MQRDSGASGNACILKGVRQSLGSEKKIIKIHDNKDIFMINMQ